MSVTVQTIYNQVLTACLEDNGFQLGIFTQQQFLDLIGIVLLDFTQRAALYKNIFTTPIQANVAQYNVPDDVMKPELCFVTGRIIEKVAEADLMQGHFEWRRKVDMPRQWHEDNLPPKFVELFPSPNFNGAPYPGTTIPVGKYGDFFATDQNLTIVGPAAPDTTSWTLGSTIQGVPDSFTPYIVYGVLEQIFSGDNELRDMQRAFYCRTRYMEGISLAEQIALKECLEDVDD